MENPLFVWRGSIARCYEVGRHITEVHRHPLFQEISQFVATHGGELSCAFCATGYMETRKRDGSLRIIRGECPFCGFWWQEDESLDWTEYRFATLCGFDLDSSELAFEELGSHLRKNPIDATHISSRRFEELVADIYRQLGFSVRLTPQTRDGGYDILLLENASGAQVIVECKRYSQERKVSVGVVRTLLGALLGTDAREAILVATTEFTGPAKQLARKINGGVSGYRLDLLDAEEFTRALNVYNVTLPPVSLAKEVVSRFQSK